MRLAYSKVRELTPQEENELITSLTDSARSRLTAKRNPELYRQSLCAYFLLRDTLGKETFLGSGFSFLPDGRPYFKELDADVSITHTRHTVACAIGESRLERVGIDAEEMSISSERQHNVASRFFSEAEKEKLRNGASFLDIWTKKEALFKCLGKAVPLSELDTENTESISFEALVFENTLITACRKQEAE